MDTRCQKKGFTLIELLIVIVIIGILATAILLQIRNAAPTARRNTAISNLNEALRVANTCQAEGASLNPFQAGQPICSGTPSVNANWPIKLDGYTYSVSIVSGAITSVTANNDSSSLPVTCDGSPINCHN